MRWSWRLPGALSAGCYHNNKEKCEKKEQTGSSQRQSPELRQWPVQLMLVSPEASYFKDSDLLVAADCVPFAYPNFHQDFLKGKSVIIGGPKLDDADFYVEKVTELIKKNSKNISLF